MRLESTAISLCQQQLFLSTKCLLVKHSEDQAAKHIHFDAWISIDMRNKNIETRLKYNFLYVLVVKLQSSFFSADIYQNTSMFESSSWKQPGVGSKVPNKCIWYRACSHVDYRHVGRILLFFGRLSPLASHYLYVSFLINYILCKFYLFNVLVRHTSMHEFLGWLTKWKILKSIILTLSLNSIALEGR